MHIQAKLHRWLVQKFPVAALGALTWLIAGCGPEEWIVWAPDGAHALVRDGTTRVIDPAGNTLGEIAGKEEYAAAWLPDSQRVLDRRSRYARLRQDSPKIPDDSSEGGRASQKIGECRLLPPPHGLPDAFDREFGRQRIGLKSVADVGIG